MPTRSPPTPRVGRSTWPELILRSGYVVTVDMPQTQAGAGIRPDPGQESLLMPNQSFTGVGWHTFDVPKDVERVTVTLTGGGYSGW